MCEYQNIFSTIKIKKNIVKIIGILLLIARFFKYSDHIIIQIIKNTILMFLILILINFNQF